MFRDSYSVNVKIRIEAQIALSARTHLNDFMHLARACIQDTLRSSKARIVHISAASLGIRSAHLARLVSRIEIHLFGKGRTVQGSEC